MNGQLAEKCYKCYFRLSGWNHQKKSGADKPLAFLRATSILPWASSIDDAYGHWSQTSFGSSLFIRVRSRCRTNSPMLNRKQSYLASLGLQFRDQTIPYRLGSKTKRFQQALGCWAHTSEEKCMSTRITCPNVRTQNKTYLKSPRGWPLVFFHTASLNAYVTQSKRQ